MKKESEARTAKAEGRSSQGEVAAELAALWRENARLKMENEFLGKASAVFAAKLRSRTSGFSMCPQ